MKRFANVFNRTCLVHAGNDKLLSSLFFRRPEYIAFTVTSGHLGWKCLERCWGGGTLGDYSGDGREERKIPTVPPPPPLRNFDTHPLA